MLRYDLNKKKWIGYRCRHRSQRHGLLDTVSLRYSPLPLTPSDAATSSRFDGAFVAHKHTHRKGIVCERHGRKVQRVVQSATQKNNENRVSLPTLAIDTPVAGRIPIRIRRGLIRLLMLRRVVAPGGAVARRVRRRRTLERRRRRGRRRRRVWLMLLVGVVGIVARDVGTTL